MQAPVPGTGHGCEFVSADAGDCVLTPQWTSSPLGFRPMPEPTKEDIDALVGPATPHFAYQLRARVEELIRGLPDNDPVKKYGLEQMELLDRLGYASSKAEEGPREPRSRPGWDELPSSAPAYEPLPPRS
jgi:RecB family exonuclease